MLQRLADTASDAMTHGLPDDVLDDVRRHMTDTLGICLAATRLSTSRGIRDYVQSQGGTARAHAIGLPDPVPPALAALVNGTLAHSLDYDDTHLPSVLHPSASVVPACLAAGEAGGASERDVLTAIGIGLEVCVRVGMAGYDAQARNSTYFDRGQHATSICGTIGAAAAVAALYGLDPAGIVDAMAIATSFASGIIEGNRMGGTVKRLHCGWAAHAAVSAAELAQHGFTGPVTALEGRFGFFRAFLDGHYDASAIADGLGERWSVDQIHIKPYPANHFTHAGIDAALEIRRRGVDVAEISAIRLGVAAPTLPTIGAPIEVKREPATGYQAQFSGPYTVVAALLGGHGLGLGLDDFTDELAVDPQRRELMKLVEVVEDAAASDGFPRCFPAVLTVTTRSGAVLSQRISVNRGGPDYPLSDAELSLKFVDNAVRVLDRRRVEELVVQLERFGAGSGVAELTSALAFDIEATV